MKVWLDAQLPPALAGWLRAQFGIDARPVRELNLRQATDREIFDAARAAGVVLISKDSDFVDLVQIEGPPPQLIWLTCGNVSNARLCTIFGTAWPKAVELLTSGEPVVEVGG